MRRTGLAILAAAALCVAAVPAWSDGEQRTPPVAELSVSPQPVVAGDGAVLDGAGSRDPDGSVTSYAWDLDGDGSFERVAGAEPRLAHVFEKAGSYSVGLRVVDDTGESADARRQVEVAAPPEPQPAPDPDPEPKAAEPQREADTPKRTRAARAQEDESEPTREEAPAARPKSEPSRVRAAASTTVSIEDFSFAPKTVTVNPGDTVTWRNTGEEPHTATGSGFDTGTLQSGESGSATFREAGNFSYKCTPHPFMTGTVRVVGSGGGGSGGGTQGAQNDGTAGDDGATGSATGGSDSLPSTGLALGSVVLTGFAMVGAGVMLRRRVGSPAAQ